jgi:hypothetical protein
MDPSRAPSHTQLFTVRVWREDLGAGQTEWRGEVHAVASGERRYFREWSTLLAVLQALLPKPELDGQRIGFPNEPEEK